MSSSKRHLYMPVKEAHDLSGRKSAGESLRQGRQFSGVHEVSSTGFNKKPSTPHRGTSSQVVVTQGLSTVGDDTVIPRSTAPQQHMTSPLRVGSHANEDLTPSDEESISPNVFLSGGRNVQSIGLSSGGLMRLEELSHVAAPAKEHEQRGYDASVGNDVLVVEAVDSAVGSGEVAVTSSTIQSPVKVIRHDTQSGKSATPPPDKHSGHASGTQHATHTKSASPNAGIAGQGKKESSLTRKPSKAKGRYVPSRYMQTASGSKTVTKAAASTSTSKPVSDAARLSRPVPSSTHGAPTAAPSSIGRRPSMKATAVQSTQTGGAAGQRVKRPAATSRSGSAAGSVAYRTPHQLPADQLLLRARQAVADSVFTPSLQAASGSTVHTINRASIRDQTPKMPKSNVSRPPSGARGNTSASRSTAHHAVASTPAQSVPATIGTSSASASNPQRLVACYSRAMQWAFLAAHSEHTFKTQEKACEVQIHSVWQEVESLQRQEAIYVERLAALKNADLVDGIVYSQLASLRNVQQLLLRLGDSHSNLARALTTVYHQLPVKGFILPAEMSSLTHTLDNLEKVLRSTSHYLHRPMASALPHIALSLESLEDCVQAELAKLREVKLLMEKACRLQTQLTSLQIHGIQLQDIK